MQTTLANKVTFSGQGLHSGRTVTVTLHPAVADHGIVFLRSDIAGSAPMAARWNRVEQTALNTRLRNAAGDEVSTIEHLMAALAGVGCHNAFIEIDGPEVPILDGSSQPFVEGLMKAGLRRLQAPLYAIEILKPVEVQQGEAWARLSPTTVSALEIDFTIDFSDAAIGHQERSMVLTNDAFVRELADSRTFCRNADVEMMQSKGLALGGTLENAVVVDGPCVLTPGGLRHADEAVRHKMLDAVGDLSTAGAPIFGRYTGMRAGHAMTNKLLRALFADPTAWRPRLVTPAVSRTLPGAGVVKGGLQAGYPAFNGQSFDRVA